MSKILATLILPREITDFERAYVQRVNRVGLLFFALHLPVFVIIAYLNDTGPMSAVVLTSLVLAGPALAFRTQDNPRTVGLIYGVTAMLMGGLLVHFGQGPVQIEMHFYFFALLAMLAVYGNPMVIVTAAVTVALHHLIVWMVLPSSVFNYDAPLWVVLVHAAFVVLESIATCTIARSFFDNVIGLEKVVQARTEALDARNRAMRLVLDNVSQGFLTINAEGVIANEYARVIETWFGVVPEGARLGDYLEPHDSGLADSFRLGWDEVVADIMPLELTIAQLPRAASIEGREFRFDYTPLIKDDRLEGALVVVSDQSAALAQLRLEAEQREVFRIFERVLRDKAGFLEYFEEANELVELIVSDRVTETEELKRVLHTLKGNSMIFGIDTVAELCHDMETAIAEEQRRPTRDARTLLEQRWEALRANLDALIGTDRGKLEIEDSDYASTLHAVLSHKPYEDIAELVGAWRLEPTERRLQRIADQAKGLARRMNKEIEVSISAGEGLRLEPQRWAPFWSAFIHVLRNAVDHGIESEEERNNAGKTPIGKLTVSTATTANEFVITVVDDGRGIDWEAVRTKARAAGLSVSTQRELTDALFQDGVSTRDVVSAFSGRGVGMGAVRVATEMRSGRIDVKSVAGQGTSIGFRFPLAEMAADPADQFRAA